MGLQDALTQVGVAGQQASQGIKQFTDSTVGASQGAEGLESNLGKLARQFADTSVIIKYEKALVGIQKFSGKSSKEIISLGKALVDVSKKTNYSKMHLIKLSAEMNSNIHVAAMSNKAWVKFTETMAHKFPEGMDSAVKVIAHFSKEFAALSMRMKSGEASIMGSTEQATIWALALDGNIDAAHQLANALTPVDEKIMETTDATKKSARELENHQLQYAKDMQMISRWIALKEQEHAAWYGTGKAIGSAAGMLTKFLDLAGNVGMALFGLKSMGLI